MSAIENISDTARWVAAYRALESDRPDALFRDPFARELAGEKGQEILRTLPGARQSAWALILRTFAFDELTVRCVAEGADTVVNLACGLDTRPWRLELPPSLQWIEVDLPGILSHKKQVLSGAVPRCRLEQVALDLRDLDARRALFERIGSEHKRVLVCTEGLLVYLTAEQVSALAADVHAPASFAWWMIDFVSPAVLALMQRTWRRQLLKGDAEMRFSVPALEYFEQFGWRLETLRSFFDDSVRLNRGMPLGRVVRALVRLSGAKRRERILQRFLSGAALFERM